MYHLERRRSARAALVVAIALTGSALLGPATPAGADRSSPAAVDAARSDDRTAARARPFRLSGSGIGIASIRSDGVITFVGAGTQQGTYLGRSTFHLEGECTNPTCTSLVARTTNVAANGDELYFLETLTDGEASLVITGGTGRFAGATGSATTTGTVTPDPANPLLSTSTFESVGTIILDRSRR